MNRHKAAVAAIACMFVLLGATVRADENLRVLPEKIDGVATADMMNHYLRSQAAQRFEKWKQEYEKRKTPEQIAEYQENIRGKFMEAIGEFPERTDLNPQVTGIVRREGYRVEKVIFESQPKHYVSALLFVPDKKRGKRRHPGVLVPCGHSRNGKAL